MEAPAPVTAEAALACANMGAEGELAWVGTLSEEDQAKYWDNVAAWEDPDRQGALLEEYNATFAAADTDNDGRLNPAELRDMFNKDIANMKARGIPVQDMSAMTEEQFQGFYDAINSMSEEPGITSAELMSWGWAMTKKMKELKQA